MKRIFIAVTIILALTSTTAFAQPRPGMAPPSGGPGAGAPGLDTVGGPPQNDPLAEYLGLTADQKTAWAAARQSFEDSIAATRDQIKAAHEQLGALMDAKSTDAAAIGTIMISIRTLNDLIKTAHDGLEAKLEATLTAEQKTKYAAFEAALAFVRSHNGPPAGPGR